MNSIPIFDCLTHPMPNGNWLIPRYDQLNSVRKLEEGMAQSNVQWAFAVGMGPNIGGYKEDEYATFIRSSSEKLFPIAYFDFSALDSGLSVAQYIRKLKILGYVGIKVHPRFSKINIVDPRLPAVIKEANQQNLAVLLCTYIWCRESCITPNLPEQLHQILCQISDQKVILIHGGGVRLLEVAELVRHFSNTLLDLSLTLCKYEGSSIDLDIKFLFERFDQRICVGSDGPEFAPKKLRERFEYFSKNIEEIKKCNIANRNLLSFTGLAM